MSRSGRLFIPEKSAQIVRREHCCFSTVIIAVAITINYYTVRVTRQIERTHIHLEVAAQPNPARARPGNLSVLQSSVWHIMWAVPKIRVPFRYP